MVLSKDNNITVSSGMLSTYQQFSMMCVCIQCTLVCACVLVFIGLYVWVSVIFVAVFFSFVNYKYSGTQTERGLRKSGRKEENLWSRF